MKEVYVNSDLTMVGLCKSILDSEGIACFIRNENTRSFGVSVFGFSNTPILDPVLCITDDNQLTRSLDLLREHVQHSPLPPDIDWKWQCPQCKETNEGKAPEEEPEQVVCWNCGVPKPPPVPLPSTDWLCAECKEPVPASFDSCWNCQTPKPDT